MADENQMDQGPAAPPQAEEKAESGVTHARKAAPKCEINKRQKRPAPRGIRLRVGTVRRVEATVGWDRIALASPAQA
jgi:hypothetical protein